MLLLAMTMGFSSLKACHEGDFGAMNKGHYKWRKNVGSNHYTIMQSNSKQLTQYNMTEATFKMAEGDIITFPSNLTFGFDSNPFDERITLSANIVPA